MRPADRRGRLADARLYLCTPVRDDLEGFLDDVLAAGVDIVQIRDKHADDQAVLTAAAIARRVADRHDALMVVNDRPDLAVAADADGVHVGQDDAPVPDVRRTVGPDVLIGWSTHAADQVDRAVQVDCDYFAVGPVAATPTKPGRPGIGMDAVRHAAAVADRPWFVTGGMAPTTAGPVLEAGAHGLVVVRALTEADDPGEVARRLRDLIRACADRPV